MTGNIVMGDDTSIGIADDAERIEFDGAGDISLLGANVGIGTTTPSQILNVEATSTPVIEISTLDDNNPASASALDLVEKQPTHAADTATFGQTGVYGYRIQLNGSDNSLRIKSGSQTTVNDRITLDRDTGKVGIGETDPDRHLHLTGSGANDARIKLENTSASYYAGLVMTASAKEFHVGVGGASVAAGYANSLYIHDATAGALRATIDTDGNVGIGNTAPGDYYSNSNQLVVGSGAARQGITIASSTSTIGQLAFADGTSGDARYEGSVLYNHSSNHMELNTNHTTRQYISSSGKTSWSAHGVGNIATQDRDFTFYTEGSTNGVAINSAANRIVFMGGAGSSGTGSDKGYLQLEAEGTAKVVFNSAGDSYINGGTFTIGETAPQGSSYGFSVYNNVVPCWFETRSSTSGHEVMILNRKNSAGTMVAFAYNDSEKGTITQSGGAVSYNAFMGSHYTETSEDTSTILVGTVMETVDALVENKYEDQKRLAKCKVSDTSESPNVYGIWFDDNETGQVAALGASFCRINSGVTVSMGDLLVSNGDGTAKLQSDDIIRSKTIGKVTSTVKKETYGDGSYVVPVVLYCG